MDMTSKTRASIINFLWLIAGSVCLLFMGGKWNIPALTWIGSIFFLRYFRNSRSYWSILAALPVIFIASHIYFIGLAEQVETSFRILINLCFTLYIMIPCLLDRLLYSRIRNGLLASLVYPSSLIFVQFLLSFQEQLGTILHWTGSMFAQKPIIQLVSVTGAWGPSFIVGWVASCFNFLWEEKFSSGKLKIPVIACTATIFTVILLGSFRMLLSPPEPGTVKVGSVVSGFREDNLFYIYDAMSDKDKSDQKEKYRSLTFEVQDDLFATSERLVSSGIKILSWASGNAAVFAEDEPELINRMQNFAKDHKIYFFPSLLVLGSHKYPDMNHVLAIQPDGEIAYDHFKGRNPNKGFYQGNIVEIIKTPYGRIASPICFEMEFHRFIRQAGKQGVDILIVPGDEPARGAANFHTELSMLRAVENGFSMVRTTLEGLTMGADYQGRVLSQLNFYQTISDRTIITEIPMKGVRTIYSRFGDWFAWVCIIMMVVLTAIALTSSSAKKITAKKEGY